MYFYKSEDKIIESKELLNDPNLKLIKEFDNDGALEKHLPQFEIENGKIHVRVGSVIHPMLDNHYIEWVAVETNKTYQKRYFKPGDSPTLVFTIGEEELVAVYAYCNLHGLWKNN